jgi:hypothetical protein
MPLADWLDVLAALATVAALAALLCDCTRWDQTPPPSGDAELDPARHAVSSAATGAAAPAAALTAVQQHAFETLAAQLGDALERTRAEWRAADDARRPSRDEARLWLQSPILRHELGSRSLEYQTEFRNWLDGGPRPIRAW